MRKLFALSMLLFIFVVYTALSQEGTTAFVNPDMIEISYDGTTWTDATALVSNIQVVVGQATATHVTHVRRGTVWEWEGQLGSPHETQKVVFWLNTGGIPTSENRFYIRWQFGLLNPDETTDESPMADPSDPVKLIGKPGKAINKGAVNQ